MTWQVRKAVLPAILVVAAVAGAIVLVRTKPVVAPSDKVEQPWLVSVSAVTLADVQPTLRLFGEIVPGREVELRALVAGEVVAVGEAFVDGGVVAKGTMIIGIDAFDYRAKFDELSAQIGEARARLEEITAHRNSYQSALAWDRELVKLHLRDVERMRSLSGRGTVSAKRMDTARMELTKQRKATEMRQSNLAAETAHVKQQRAVIQRLASACGGPNGIYNGFA
jgi:multidrug efflux pump subunit AcrA (membrane-fusion protein)